MPVSDPKIIVALDYSDAKQAFQLAEQLDSEKCRLKVGKELFTSSGPGVVTELQRLGYEVFLDLKFHDIPNTAARACAQAAELGVWMVNVHASGGRKMMEHCVEELSHFGSERPYLIGVTVLTSLTTVELNEAGVACSAEQQVLRLARLAQVSGLDGVVCSAQEAILLREEVDSPFLLVAPGIRPLDAEKDDQKRICTPRDALDRGVNYLVIGRPITKADKPGDALLKIHEEICRL